MRILLIASGYLPYTFSENLCNAKLVYALQEESWEVDVISKQDEGPTYTAEWSEPWMCLKEHTYEIQYPLGNKLSRIYDFVLCSVQMGGFPLIGIRWARRAFRKALELHKIRHYDAIFTRSPNDISHIVGHRLSKKTKVKWIANWNDPASTIWPEPYTHQFSKSKYRMLNRYNHICLKNATINTFPSQNLLAHFQSFYPFLKNQRTIVIPHIGLAENILPSSIYKKRDKIYFCHSGNLSFQRNPENTFNAIKELIDEKSIHIQLDIMGHVNAYTLSLIKKYSLENHVYFTGSYSYIEALQKMQEYDVFVLIEAMMKEGIFFPSKFTDYAQLNKPILAISPSSGFANSILKENGGGIAVSNEDYKDIKKGIECLYHAWENNTINNIYNTQKLFSRMSTSKVVSCYKKMFE